MEESPHLMAREIAEKLLARKFESDAEAYAALDQAIEDRMTTLDDVERAAREIAKERVRGKS